MNSFANGIGQQVLWLHQNVLLIPESNEIVGIVLGQCIFSRRGALKGKYFNHTLYDEKGRIIAKECNAKCKSEHLYNSLVQNASFILEKIKKHHISWITPGTTWIKEPVLDFLTA